MFFILLLKKHYKNIKLQVFPIATFYFRHFVFYVSVIMVRTQLWTKQSDVRTNTKYTSYVNSF